MGGTWLILFFNQYPRYDMIPVVYGLAPYEDFVPPHSFIDVMDFESIGHLAKHLRYLDSNDTAYNEYFRLVSIRSLFFII